MTSYIVKPERIDCTQKTRSGDRKYVANFDTAKTHDTNSETVLFACLSYGMLRVRIREFMLMTELIGLMAAMLITVSFLPQAILTCRTGNTDGISLSMYLLFTIGVVGWLIYGLLTISIPVIAANAVTLVIASVILAMKVRSVFGRSHVAARV